MPTSMLVVLDSIAAARPALSGAVVLHARNADRAADARRALPKAEAVVDGHGRKVKWVLLPPARVGSSY
jgi:hypothetical protein